MYLRSMPRLRHDTRDTHRAAVRDAVLDASAAIVANRGLAAVTMSEIAERAGIGRATLYRYYPDVDTVLHAWHERQVGSHVRQLEEIRGRRGTPIDRLEAVLETFAFIAHAHHASELAALLHQGAHVAHAQRQLRGVVRDLIADGIASGDVRDDVSPDELATFCLHALTAASALPSEAAVRRLVTITLDGLRA